jgi:hypothetical protein
MPWNLALCALLLGACLFQADYGAGIPCSDGKCPAGLVCVTQGEDRRCLSEAPPIDAAPSDGTTSALTCVAPGALSGTGMASGTTAGRSSMISSSCGGFVMNGFDAVYRAPAVTVGQHLVVSVTGLKAYVIAPCAAFQACLGNTYATQVAPISVTAATAGPYFVVVDHETAGMAGSYTLTVTVN